MEGRREGGMERKGRRGGSEWTGGMVWETTKRGYKGRSGQEEVPYLGLGLVCVYQQQFILWSSFHRNSLRQ